MEYQKYEFCKAKNCKYLNAVREKCRNLISCYYTAKEFHTWLEEHNFKIVKQENNVKKYDENEAVLICPLHRLMCTGCDLSARIPRGWLSESLNKELDFIDDKYKKRKKIKRTEQ